MATLTDNEIKDKCEEATNYGLKKRGCIYFKTTEEQEKAWFYLDVFLFYHVTGFNDDKKGYGLKFRLDLQIYRI